MAGQFSLTLSSVNCNRVIATVFERDMVILHFRMAERGFSAVPHVLVCSMGLGRRNAKRGRQ